MASARDREKGMGSEKGPAHDGAADSGPFRRRTAEGGYTLGDLDPQLLIEALDAVLNAGCLMSLGRTSDGGAIGFYVTDEKKRFKDWGHDPDEMSAILTSLLNYYRG